MAHSHGHGGCTHHSAAGMSQIKLKLSLGLTLGFVVLETFAGVRAGSLALLSDAGHNFTDALALGLSWYALWIAGKPATPSKTYGFHRVGILTALFNALSLIVIAAFIFTEAWQLFLHPHAVSSLPMIAVAGVAFVMNTTIALGLRGEAKNNVNMRSAFIHMAGDALSSLGVIAAGAVIYFTHWSYADPLVSLLIGAFIVYSSWGIVRETVNVLLEGTPRGLDAREMAQAMQSVEGVTHVHDLHVWTIGDGMNALSCHLRVDEDDMPRAQRVVQDVKILLAERYDVRHSTIETECGGECDLAHLYCQMNPAHDHAHDPVHAAVAPH